MLASFDLDWEFGSGKSNTLADVMSCLAKLDSTSLEEVEEPDICDDDDLEFVGPISERAAVAIAALIFATTAIAALTIAPFSLNLNLAALLEPGTSESKSLAPAKGAALITQLPPAFLNPLPAAYETDPLICPIVKSLNGVIWATIPIFAYSMVSSSCRTLMVGASLFHKDEPLMQKLVTSLQHFARQLSIMLTKRWGILEWSKL